MMTFVLVPAEGDRNFKADVWCLKGRQTITGSWSKGEDDVYTNQIQDVVLICALGTDVFQRTFPIDPERDALTGIWGLSADLESSVGKMEFRRIPARYLTVYPCIKELARCGGSQLLLCEMTYGATVGHVSQRRDDRNAVIPLLVRSRWFGTPLSDEEAETLHVIARRLIPTDAFFYDSKVDHIRAYTWVHEWVLNAANPVS
jgi:hypothetical protein